MKKIKIILAIISAFSLIAIFTNPTQEMHKEKVKEKINSFLQTSLTQNIQEAEDDYEGFGYFLGNRLGTSIVKYAVNELVIRKNYFLFSTTNITWAGKTQVIGVGAFGSVFLSKKLDEKYEKMIQEFDFKD